MAYEIKPYDHLKHRHQVVALWETVFGYAANHNAPERVIAKKLDYDDGLFFVAIAQETVIGTVMAGYDGHRGWIYSMAVSPDHRKQGVGSRLLIFAEDKLSKLGCMKINLQVMEDNAAVARFYLSNGFHTEKRISMGKRLPQNIQSRGTGGSSGPSG